MACAITEAALLKTAVAIRHLAFEDLGTFKPVLPQAGLKVHYYDVGVDELWTLEPVKTDLIIILGGPIGDNEDDQYPFLTAELKLLEDRTTVVQGTSVSVRVDLGGRLIIKKKTNTK